MDDPRARVEEEHDVAGVLPDLVVVPHEGLGRPARCAAGQRFDVLGPDRVLQVRGKLLLSGARPWLKRHLTVRRVCDPARVAGQAVVVAQRIGPVALHVGLAVGQARAGPLPRRRRHAGALTPVPLALGRRDGGDGEQQCNQVLHRLLIGPAEAGPYACPSG